MRIVPEEAPSTSMAWLVRNNFSYASWTRGELKRLRKPTGSDWNRMVQRRRRAVIKLVDDLKARNISISEFERYFDDGLKRSHINAAVIGRQRAGDLADETELDEIFGILNAQRDLPFVRALIRDLESGRYMTDGVMDDIAVKRRAIMYVDKARSTANEAFALASPQHSVFDWLLTGVEHCTTCPAKAEGGPYDLRQLGIIGYPSSGKDACRTNCKCVIQRSDGVRSFARVPMAKIPASPARQLVNA